jgi:hypothetical protein
MPLIRIPIVSPTTNRESIYYVNPDNISYIEENSEVNNRKIIPCCLIRFNDKVHLKLPITPDEFVRIINLESLTN